MRNSRPLLLRWLAALAVTLVWSVATPLLPGVDWGVAYVLFVVWLTSFTLLVILGIDERPLVALSGLAFGLGLVALDAYLSVPVAASTGKALAAVAIAVLALRAIRRVSFLLVIAIVIAVVDFFSATSAGGTTHQLAEHGGWFFDLIRVSLVDGTGSWQPALGVTDVLFFALFLGAARTWRLPLGRNVVASFMVLLAVGWLASTSDLGVPALPFIALGCVVTNWRQLWHDVHRTAGTRAA